MHAGLEVNHFDKEKCQGAFNEYKACKKQEVWGCVGCALSGLGLHFERTCYSFDPSELLKAAG